MGRRHAVKSFSILVSALMNDIDLTQGYAKVTQCHIISGSIIDGIQAAIGCHVNEVGINNAILESTSRGHMVLKN